MKKLLAVLFAIVMVATLCFSVSAAVTSGINAAEQAVLDKLKTTEKLGSNGATFAVPTQYINAAENFFQTIDMTDEQGQQIIAFLDQAIATIRAQGANTTVAVYKMSYMDNAAKRSVLKNGQDACQVVGATLVYDPSTDKITITRDANGELLFQNTPLIKTTGEAFTATTAFAGTVIVLAAVGATAALYITAKKNGLLVK